jgi:hypothetical protein
MPRHLFEVSGDLASPLFWKRTLRVMEMFSFLYFWLCFKKSADTVTAWNGGTGRKSSSCNLKYRYCCRITWRERLKLAKTSLRIASLRAEIRTRNVMELCDLVSKSVWFVSSFISVNGVDVDLLQIKSAADRVNKQYRYYYPEKINDCRCWHSLQKKIYV